MPIPLCRDKYDAPSVFQPQDFLSYMKKSGKIREGAPVPEAAIFSYQRSLLDYVNANHPVTHHDGYFGRQLGFLGDTGGKVAIIGRFGVGAPAAVVMLEELIAFGVKRFVSVGTAGGLVKGLFPGELVVCSGALRDEGASYHYLPEGRPALPDPGLSDALAAAFDSASVPYRRGLSWTTDGIYRETRPDVDAAVALGAVTVEMEAAALFAAAEYRRVPLAACFTISDSLAETEWRAELLSDDTNSGLEKLYRAALAALSPG